MSKATSIHFDVGRAMDLSNLHSNKLNTRNLKASMVVTHGPIFSQSRGFKLNHHWLLKKHAPHPTQKFGTWPTWVAELEDPIWIQSNLSIFRHRYSIKKSWMLNPDILSCMVFKSSRKGQFNKIINTWIEQPSLPKLVKVSGKGTTTLFLLWRERISCTRFGCHP